MHQILVYADSLSWGVIPNTRKRFDFEKRWPGVVEHQLGMAGVSARVIEDCLNGRRTAWEDPFKPGRNGLIGLEQRIEVNSPLSLVVVFLGTNDFQTVHQSDAWQSAQGVGAIFSAIRRAPVESGMPEPDILLVAPPPIRTPKGTIARKFANAEKKSQGLAEAIRDVAQAADCHFFDAGSVTDRSQVDGIHLDEDQHLQLGLALAAEVKKLINSSEYQP